MQLLLKRFSIVLALSICFLNVNGQDLNKMNHKEIAAKESENISDLLRLDSSQKVIVLKIQVRFFKKLVTIPSDYSIEKRAQDMANNTNELERELKKILTGKQWEKYQSLLKLKQEKFKLDLEYRREIYRNTQ